MVVKSDRHKLLDGRIQVRIPDADVVRLDSWMAANDVRARSDALRHVIAAGLKALVDVAEDMPGRDGQRAEIKTLKELVRRVGAVAVASTLEKDGHSGRVTVSRYANARQAITLAQAAKLRRAFPELDLNQAAEALLQIEEERAAEEGTES